MQDQVDTTRDYLTRIMDNIVDSLPKFLGAVLILIIGYIIAKVVAAIVRRSLAAARLNQHLRTGQGGNLIQRAVPDPTNLVAVITYWAIFLFSVSVALSALGIPALVDLVHGIYAYLPNVLAAILIFLVASGISAAVATLVTNTMGDTPTGKVAASAAPVVVMGLATFMILNQLKIAPEIVTITYAGLVGTAVLAFGLGGKDAASRMFMGMYETGLRNRETVKQDLKKGGRSAKAKANDLKNRV